MISRPVICKLESKTEDQVFPVITAFGAIDFSSVAVRYRQNPCRNNAIERIIGDLDDSDLEGNLEKGYAFNEGSIHETFESDDEVTFIPNPASSPSMAWSIYIIGPLPADILAQLPPNAHDSASRANDEQASASPSPSANAHDSASSEDDEPARRWGYVFQAFTSDAKRVCRAEYQARAEGQAPPPGGYKYSAPSYTYRRPPPPPVSTPPPPPQPLPQQHPPQRSPPTSPQDRPRKKMRK